MDLQLLEVVLWPRLSDLPPRRLHFTPGAVNVVTGASRTGKSAIIPIVDYCLGSDRCTIPVNIIRDSTSWFGVVMQTSQGQKLFARREPGALQSTSDMYVLEAEAVRVPDRIDAKNTTVETAKELLNELAGLTRLDFDFHDDESGFKGRPSFRDMGAFVFQPQNVVANPDVLFYKADSYEHREKLRIIFPYVIGAIGNETLALQHRARRLRRLLQQKERELQALQDISARWWAEARSRISRALELGLLTEKPSEDASFPTLVDTLRGLLQQGEAVSVRGVSTESVNDAVRELVELQKEEASVSSELADLRRRLTEMQRLRNAAMRYKDATAIRRDRLRISEWIATYHEPEHRCPICGSTEGSQTKELQGLREALKRAEEEFGDFASVPAAFDREYERVRVDIETSTEQLSAVRIRRQALANASGDLKSRQFIERATWQFLGGLEEAIDRYDKLAPGSELVEEVETIRDELKNVEAELRRRDVRTAIERALGRVSAFASRILPKLDVERPDDPIELSIQDLSVRVVGPQRSDYLWEIGSGANWLSYHVATLIALQQLFGETNNSAVPNMLIFDQPSQVYFPWRLGMKGVPDDIRIEEELEDEDIEAVKKVFQVLADACKAARGGLEVIVLDHASTGVWGQIAGINLVEEWREGRKLIPREWLPA